MHIRSHARGRARHWLATAALALAATCAHADLVVPAGGGYDLAGGSTDLGCSDVIVAGTLNLSGGRLTNVRHVSIAAGGVVSAGAGNITLSGDWSNAGGFNAGSGYVSFVDAPSCATTSTISGNSTFNHLSFVTSVGKLYRFAAGSTQRVLGVLTMNGNGQPIRIESTVAGSFANIDASIFQNMANLAVRDMSASGAWIAEGLTNMAAGAQVYRWFGIQVVPVGSPMMLALLLLALLGFGLMTLRTRGQNKFEGKQ